MRNFGRAKMTAQSGKEHRFAGQAGPRRAKRGAAHTPQVKSMVRGQSVCEHTLTQRAANSARASDSTLARRAGWAGRGGGPPRPHSSPATPAMPWYIYNPHALPGGGSGPQRKTSKTTEPALTAPALRSTAARAAPLAGSV